MSLRQPLHCLSDGMLPMSPRSFEELSMQFFQSGCRLCHAIAAVAHLAHWQSVHAFTDELAWQ